MKSSRGSGDLQGSALSISQTSWYRCENNGSLDRLDVTRSAFFNGPDNYGARLLSLEGPTPRARTYADRLSENSREVTLVAEAALRGHIR